MKTTLRYRNINAPATWNRKVDEQLNHLDSLTPISFAAVVLERQRDNKPAFRVKVRLEVPGPGFHAGDTRHKHQVLLLLHGRALRAEAIGDTIQAALLKATEYLEHQVKARQLRSMERGKSKLKLGGVNSQWTGTQAGQKAEV
jgi:ribosome-associated translation inhibitor RaiA